MTYDEFMENLRNNICAHVGAQEDQLNFYPDGWKGSGDAQDNEFIQDTNHRYHRKDDSETLIGDYLELEVEDKQFGKRTCQFSIEYLYDEFQRDGWDRVWYIVDENIKLRNNTSFNDVINTSSTYESIKSQLIIRLLNFSDNRYELRNACYHRFGDIAIVLYALGCANERNTVSMKIPKQFLERWGIDIDTAIDEALLNTNVTRPPRLYFSEAELEDPPYERGAFMALGANYHIMGPAVAPILTTYPSVNGAVAMFYPGVAKKLGEVMGGSYYVSFTSIHEARLHLKGSKPTRTILNALRSVNKAFNPNEILSRKLYFYDVERDALEQIEL